MPIYQIANLRIDSAIALPAARAASAGAGAWRFAIDRRAERMKERAWYHHERDRSGRVWRSLARTGDKHVIRFWRRGSFAISFAQRRITAYPRPSTPTETIRQLLIGHVLPVVFEGRGALALHASAVRLPSGVVAFLSETQGGKSTIAAALGVRGCALVADDCAIVEVADGDCRVRPMAVGLRLWPDAVRMFNPEAATRKRGKTRVTPAALGINVDDRPAHLHRLYLLQSSPAAKSVSVAPVSRADAVVALLCASFQLGMDQPAQLKRSFENLSAVAARVPVRRLSRPNGLRHLAAVVETVLEDAAN